jgi:uncharacterized membrane protein (UPF0127 family)
MERQVLVSLILFIVTVALLAVEAYVCSSNDCTIGNHPHYGAPMPLMVWNLTRRAPTTYDVYTAQTPGELLDGLMNYKFSCAIPNGCINGMLFLFPNDSQQCFWMKNTPEPLTQIWFNASGVVTAVYNAAPEDTNTVCNEGNAVLELYSDMPEQVHVGDYLPFGGISAIRSQLAGTIP